MRRKGRAICFIAWLVVREGLRQHVVAGFCVAYALFVGGTGILRTLHFGSDQLEFVTQTGLAGASLGGAICTVVLSVQFFLGEFEDGIALVLFSKPVTRSDYVIGKWLGTMGLMGGFFVWVTVVLGFQIHAAGSAIGEAGTRFVQMEVGVRGIIEWFKCGLLCAAVQCVSAFLRTRVLATLTGLVILILCHARPLLDEAAIRIGPPLVQQMLKAVVRIVPDFRRFDLDWHGSGEFISVLTSLAAAAPYGLVYLVGLLLAGGLILQRKEI